MTACRANVSVNTDNQEDEDFVQQVVTLTGCCLPFSTNNPFLPCGGLLQAPPLHITPEAMSFSTERVVLRSQKQGVSGKNLPGVGWGQDKEYTKSCQDMDR